MILGEKSAFVAGPDRSKLSGNIYSFSDVVDETCKKLMDQQIKYSIRRLQEMDECLAGLEKELDYFLLQQNRK